MANFSSIIHLLLKSDMNMNLIMLKIVTRCRDSRSAKTVETR